MSEEPVTIGANRAQALGTDLDEWEQVASLYWQTCAHSVGECPACAPINARFRAASQRYFEALHEPVIDAGSAIWRQKKFTRDDLALFSAEVRALTAARKRLASLRDGTARQRIDAEIEVARLESRVKPLAFHVSEQRKLRKLVRKGKGRRIRTIEIDGKLYCRTGRYNTLPDGTRSEIVKLIESVEYEI